MRSRQIALFFLLLVCSMSTELFGNDASRTRDDSVALCTLLEVIGVGEVIPVVVAGVYQVGPEAQVFFDADQPKCSRDVQPATWIEFAPSVRGKRELNRATDPAGRAYVTFHGKLHGPGPLGADDLALPFAASFASRTSSRRYGHMGAFRTKLVVDMIRDVEPVSESVVWQWGGGAPDNRSGEAVPVHFDIPRYPVAAMEQGVTGEVQARIVVEAGQVQEVVVTSGDRILHREVEEYLRSWRFNPDVSGTHAVTFTYDLEWRDRADRVPRVELRLPSAVRVIGARFAW